MKIEFLVWDRRRKAGMTIRELEHASGVSRTAIDEIENNRRMPRFDTMVRLSLALECDINDLFRCEIR